MDTYIHIYCMHFKLNTHFLRNVIVSSFLGRAGITKTRKAENVSIYKRSNDKQQSNEQ